MLGIKTPMTRDDDNVLIENVKQHRVIYDKSHMFFFDVGYKRKSWEEIGKALNRNGIQCKKRWKLLREKFVKKFKESSTGNDSAWPHFQNMLFLKQYIQPRKTCDAKCYETTCNAKCNNTMSNDTEIMYKFEFIPDSPSPSAENANEDIFAPPPTKTKKTVEGAIEAIEAAANAIKEKVNRTVAPENDLDTLMAKTIIGLLNEIPECSRDAARADLFQYVFELKAKYVDIKLF